MLKPNNRNVKEWELALPKVRLGGRQEKKDGVPTPGQWGVSIPSFNYLGRQIAVASTDMHMLYWSFVVVKELARSRGSNWKNKTVAISTWNVLLWCVGSPFEIISSVIWELLRVASPYQKDPDVMGQASPRHCLGEVFWAPPSRRKLWCWPRTWWKVYISPLSLMHQRPQGIARGAKARKREVWASLWLPPQPRPGYVAGKVRWTC